KKISAALEPRPPAALAQVDAVGEHGEGLGRELELGPARPGGLRPGEGALFQTLGQHPEAGSVEVEDLEPVAPLVAEHEERSAAGVLLEDAFGEGVEPVEALAHVAGFEREVDAQAGR